MTADDAYRRVAEQLPPDLVGRFYSPGDAVGLGKGKIYDGLAYPLYEPDQGTFATAAGLAYVLTHECDVEPDNERLFNEELLVCPIVPLEHLVQAYEADLPGEL